MGPIALSTLSFTFCYIPRTHIVRPIVLCVLFLPPLLLMIILTPLPIRTKGGTYLSDEQEDYDEKFFFDKKVLGFRVNFEQL